MLRVLYDHEFFSVFGYSGITRYFHEIIRRVAVAEGYRASLFMGFHVNLYGLERERGNLERFFGMRRPAIPKTRRLFDAVNDCLFPWFGRLARPDIYHQTYYAPFWPGFRGRRIVTVHDMTYELLPEFFPPGEPSVSHKRDAVKLAHGIIAISESTKRDLMEILQVPESKIRVIHHGNSLTADPGPAPVRPRPYLLYVGQRVAHKNFGALLEAYGRNARIRAEFELVCFGGPAFDSAESARILALGLEGRVHQLSGPDSLMANLYRYAAALVYPSRYEGFGLPVLEALGYGCPVALSKVSSLPEVAGEAGVYFDPRDGGDIDRALERILFDANLRAELARMGPEQASKFSWERCARETLEFYRHVAGA